MNPAESWASGAINRRSEVQDYIGLSYADASRRMQAICKVAAERGRTVNASYHLDKLRDVCQRSEATVSN